MSNQSTDPFLSDLVSSSVTKKNDAKKDVKPEPVDDEAHETKRKIKGGSGVLTKLTARYASEESQDYERKSLVLNRALVTRISEALDSINRARRKKNLKPLSENRFYSDALDELFPKED